MPGIRVMNQSGDRLRFLAQRSVHCVVCRRARRQQAGLAFWLVRTFARLCPFCRAYAVVYGRKSYEPEPARPAPTGARERAPLV